MNKERWMVTAETLHPNWGKVTGYLFYGGLSSDKKELWYITWVDENNE